MGSRAIVNIGVQQFVITRPRRFGKTLNMSMVDCFFPTNMQAGKICSKGLKFGRHTDICNPWSVVSFIGKKENMMHTGQIQAGTDVSIRWFRGECLYQKDNGEIDTGRKL